MWCSGGPEGRLLIRPGDHSVTDEAVKAAGGKPQHHTDIGVDVTLPVSENDIASLIESIESESDDDDEDEWPPAARDAVHAWSVGVATAQVDAPRFQLKPGEALLIDNFRMLHGRDPYHDLRRKFWRLWHWTDSAMDVPVDPTVARRNSDVSSKL